MIRNVRIMRLAGALCALLLALLTFAPVAAYHDDPNVHHDFASPHFENTWARTDKPVADGKVDRTWMWGPEPYTPGMQEAYANSPSGMREVQYFDKSRMEINNPNAPDDGLWFVTNGLLVVEMVDGKYQTGDAQFDNSPNPADIPIAGDPGGASPTYADIAEYGLRGLAPLADDATITQTLDAHGAVTTDNAFAQYNVTAAHHVTEPGIDHQVASPFWEFMNSNGMVWENGQYTDAQLFENPFYATGYPITDAYWTRTNVAGTEHDVLWQCFERRCLTYTPQNNEGFQVEAGNVGQHYYKWRYGQQPASADTLFMAHLTGDQEGTAVTTDASGDAVVCVSPDGQSVTFMISVQNITDATLAHIPLGAAGVTGDVVVPLFPMGSYTAPFSGSGTLVEGTFTSANFVNDLAGMTIADLVNAMSAGGAYVNVHTTQNPMGEIRGQLAVADNVQMSASLSGAAEVPPVTTDATGTAVYTYNHDTHSLHYQLDVQNVTNAKLAHIHLGDVGANGNVVAPLFPTDAYTAPFSGSGTLASGDITGANLVNDLAGMSVEELVCQMLMGHAYTNVHTTANPMGEIRGQIMLGALPPVDTSAHYSVTLGALNASGVTGSGTVTVDGNQAHVMLDVHGLEAGHDHMSHIHGFTDGTISTCPTQALDTNPSDGIVSLTEGLSAYGAVQLDLGMLTPDAGDDVSLDQTYTLDATQLAALGNSLADNAIVVHGLMVGDTYDATVPVACGLVAADNASTTFEADLTGAAETMPVDTVATSSFVLRMDAGGASLSWQLIGANFDEHAIEAHIHDAATGDILYTLWFTEGNPFTGTGQISSGLISAADGHFNTDVTYADLVNKIAAGGVYVNVHSAEHMDGYVSGAVYGFGMGNGS